ncbi:hypothetical protein ACHAWX_003799 [Stephanocyclus meneghinianus]
MLYHELIVASEIPGAFLLPRHVEIGAVEEVGEKPASAPFLHRENQSKSHQRSFRELCGGLGSERSDRSLALLPPFRQ